ncbi:MAG: peptide chain release factor N(5)-glutamine methyltransferase [Actinomycetota bacterium]
MTPDERSPITWRELLEETGRVLGERPAARWLCETACGLDGQEFLDELDAPATERMVAHLDAMVQRYRQGEPLAYVMGRWSFRTIDVLVDPRALIPRPETEIVAERAIELARSRPAPRRVVDLGTGTGVIGLSMAVELPVSGTEIWMTDVSTEALDLACANVAGIGRAGANVRLAEGSWFAALPEDLRGVVDVVVSNPPYIAVGDDEVQVDVVEWEPHGALFAGSDGLDALRIVISDAPQWLMSSGWLIVEIGHRQGSSVSALMSEAGFTEVRVGRDLADRDRYVEGRSP